MSDAQSKVSSGGGLGRAWQHLRYSARFVRELGLHAQRGFAEDRGPQIAAALTYHTVFSLLPTMALVLIVLKTFVGPAEQAAFKDVIVNFIASWLAGDDLPAGAPVLDPLMPQVPDSLEREARYGNMLARLDENVMRLLDELQSIDFQRIGVFGALLFIYAATGLLATVEQSFNQIFDAPGSRPWYVRVPLYYTTITLAPMVIIAGQVMQGRLLASIETISWTNWLTRPVAAMLPIVTTWLVFMLMYALIPNARVNLRAAAIGAMLAAAVWVGALEIFAIYIGSYAAASLYGALALVPLALLFVWVAWIIVLVGLVITRTLQFRPWRAGDRDSEHPRPAAYDPRWLLLLTLALQERFERGATGEVTDLATELQLPDYQVAAMLDALEGDGLVHRVEGPVDQATGYVLARPPTAIELNRLLDLAEHHTLGEVTESRLTGSRVIERLRRARREALNGETLASARSS
jgi:membrane protein